MIEINGLRVIDGVVSGLVSGRSVRLADRGLAMGNDSNDRIGKIWICEVRYPCLARVVSPTIFLRNLDRGNLTYHH